MTEPRRDYRRPTVTPVELLTVLNRAADAVAEALGEWSEWGPSGLKEGQYSSDLAADAAAIEVLDAAGLGVLSEESGRCHLEREVVVVLDPLDGSTNASRGISWWATSLCAVDAEGPAAAVVVDLVHGTRYEASRGGGARRDGHTLVAGGPWQLGEALVGLSGLPPRHLGWKQFRALGASALDLCAVADGRLDAFVDCSPDAHGPWDYLGAFLVCLEAGASVVDAAGRDLVVLEHGARRTPVAAANGVLLEQLLDARAAAFAAG
jgi:fructose-1,6-bisphosphatase/inositol monophosphatase family enzyme